eukprot:Em0024g430a
MTTRENLRALTCETLRLRLAQVQAGKKELWESGSGYETSRLSGSKKETTHRVTEPQEQEYRLDYIGVLKGINTKRVWIDVELNGIPLKMELDTGASGQSPPTGARGNPPALDEHLKRYDVIFKQQLGKIKDLKATIRVQSEATPKYFKPRPVAYALRERVEQELERLVAIGVIEPISHSEWAAPIVPVIKNNGDVRMCGDFKVTVNQCLDIEQYPLPKIDDLYAKLQGGERFTILDLSTSDYPLVLSSAPALFQRAMDTILQGLPGVVCYQDDILVTGKEIDQHLKNLEREVAFDKVQISQRIRIVNYYGKFIQSVADLCAPLNELLQKNTPWMWTATCMESINQLKQALGSAEKHGNADGLSRYPSTESEAIDGEEVGDRILALYGPQLAACPLTVKDIERGTISDALLRQVLKFTKDGWNKTGRVDDQLRPYFNRSPFFGKMWLIVIDARTKWPEVFQLNEATSGTTITALMTTFSRFGLPEIIVTDNGSQFTSDQFKTFCDENGIRHVRVAPYHPSSNGEAERFVKTFKRAFSAMGNEKDPVRRLQQFLFSYRNTLHSTLGVSPAELLVGRQLRGESTGVSEKTENSLRQTCKATYGILTLIISGKENRMKPMYIGKEDAEYFPNRQPVQQTTRT